MEYKYKAKRVDNGEWTQGSLFSGCNNSVIMQRVQFSIENENEMKVIGSIVDKNTICRYAGNGLWQNDIIMYEDCIGVIEYGEHGTNIGFYVKWISERAADYRTDLIYWANKEGVVHIGNVFDDKKLIIKMKP